jgi:hypothetical protein
MATFTRINGDAGGVVNVDIGRMGVLNANGNVINTGIAAPLSFYKVTFPNGNLAAELTTGGAVESVLRWVEGNATVLAYQVDSGSQISIITERSGWGTTQGAGNYTYGSDASSIQSFIISQALLSPGAGNIGATGNVWAGGAGAFAVVNEGFKLA